jgi:serine/arginine repetitive matrix protein 1
MIQNKLARAAELHSTKQTETFLKTITQEERTKKAPSKLLKRSDMESPKSQNTSLSVRSHSPPSRRGRATTKENIQKNSKEKSKEREKRKVSVSSERSRSPSPKRRPIRRFHSRSPSPDRREIPRHKASRNRASISPVRSERRFSRRQSRSPSSSISPARSSYRIFRRSPTGSDSRMSPKMRTGGRADSPSRSPQYRKRSVSPPSPRYRKRSISPPLRRKRSPSPYSSASNS